MREFSQNSFVNIFIYARISPTFSRKAGPTDIDPTLFFDILIEPD